MDLLQSNTFLNPELKLESESVKRVRPEISMTIDDLAGENDLTQMYTMVANHNKYIKKISKLVS